MLWEVKLWSDGISQMFIVSDVPSLRTSTVRTWYST